MFRTTQYCDRYEFLSYELDTPITQPAPRAEQEKGYSFTINDRTSYHDWYKAYLKIRFKVVKDVDNTNFGDGVRIAPINDAASLIRYLRISLNGRSLYNCVNAYRMINIKNLLNKSIDYTKSIATNEYYYPDENETTVIDKGDDDFNKGYSDRQQSINAGKEENAIIPLNKFSFFDGLRDNILPPAQVSLVIKLTEDDTLLFRNAGVDNGKVIVTKLVLWVPRLNLKAEGMRLVMERYLSPNTTWSYLCGTILESTSGRQIDRTWQITSSVLKPRHVFVYLQKDDKNISQTENVHILDTFNLGAAHLTSARLEVGSGIFYPERDYSYDDIDRIYRDVIEYSHKQDDKDTGLFLTRDRFTDIYGMLYFNLTYNSGRLDLDPVQLVLRYKLDQDPGVNYKAFAIILYEQSVMVNMVGSEISII